MYGLNISSYRPGFRALVTTLFFGASSSAWATNVDKQPAEESVPEGTVGNQAPASSGSTELDASGKFGTAAEAPADLEKGDDALELSVQAGGVLATGNSRTALATGRVDFRLRRKVHQFEATAAGNYGAAWLDEPAPTPTNPDATKTVRENTAQNIQGRARYDLFFHKRWSVFTMLTARHDPMQFLDLRLNVDPGVAFYALQDPKHRLWFEAGYDFQYDIYSDDAVAGDGMPVPDDLVTHASRLFGGYSNSLNENVTVNTGVEYLQSLTAAEQHRVNWDSVLTVQLINRLSLASSFTLRYESRIEENKPEGFKPVDTITSLNLVYRIR